MQVAERRRLRRLRRQILRVHQFHGQSIGVEILDHGVFAIEPAGEVDLLATDATEREAGSFDRRGRQNLVADRAGDRLNHGEEGGGLMVGREEVEG